MKPIQKQAQGEPPARAGDRACAFLRQEWGEARRGAGCKRGPAGLWGRTSAQAQKPKSNPLRQGGVLEPEGIVDIKFRSDDLLKAMRRALPHLASLAPAEAARVEKELLPLFKQARWALARIAMGCRWALNGLATTTDGRAHWSVVQQQQPAAPMRSFRLSFPVLAPGHPHPPREGEA